MKFEEIKNLQLKELLKKQENLKQEILESKIKLGLQRLAHPLKIRQLRRDKARVAMVIHQRLKEKAQNEQKSK